MSLAGVAARGQLPANQGVIMLNSTRRSALKFLGGGALAGAGLSALSTAAIAPLVVVGIFLERYIVSGLTTGAGK